MGSLESGSHGVFDVADSQMDLATAPPEVPGLDGTLNGYLAFALKHSPETRAAFERWRSATLKISRARRLPEPSLTFGYFVRSVETRVGPQRFKVGISQTFPWPTKLSAGSDAAAERARAFGRAFDAEVLSIKRNVAMAYWLLWLVHEEHRLKTEHDAVLESLAGAVRGRLKTGAAALAELNQIELSIARHHDHHGQHKEQAHKVSAMLLAAIGVDGSEQNVKATDRPHPGLPGDADENLRVLAREHPHIMRHEHLAASEMHRAESERAERYPRFRLGVDFIETGNAAMPGVADSGKDPIMVMAGISLPLWGGSYSDSIDSAKAASAAHQADKEAATRSAERMFAAALSDVRDAQRRIDLYEKTLVPQAETTFQAVLGGYQTGRSTVAAVILAQRDLLELQIEHARARAKHARAWASLEYSVGTELDSAGGA